MVFKEPTYVAVMVLLSTIFTFNVTMYMLLSSLFNISPIGKIEFSKSNSLWKIAVCQALT